MAAPRKPTVEEEDLDDLDDVLEQFSAPPPKPPAKPAPASTSSSQTPLANDAPPSAPKAVDPFGLGGLDADFAAELTRGMESLFKDIAGGAGLDGIPGLSEAEDGTTDEERAKAFKAAWEAMLVEGMDGAMSAEEVSDKGKAAEGAAPGVGAPTDSFQENIRKAMERMKESDRKADEATSSGDGLDDIFSKLGDGVNGMESEEELQGLLENMMSQLMSKAVLYEPLKELSDKFPSYLKDNATTLSDEDKTRFAAQSKVVAQIVATFEDPSYTEDDPVKGLKIVELMQEMQEHGSPPAEIMGPLPPGFDLGADGLPKVPEGCTIA
ncbi:Pex19 protein [Trametes versicolor FP-101664 SS1]|uniref:Pex19 protein n=1 Tax=Trametes versicolor (strain FP-101664) TaxID=717944 RepID=UPI0004622BA6|nr:Pex19 protein [Trametes versicolor FP-101664 SS1]EIW56168.1 Pex19 protein [Trametes versicolor FP-101664 SS1]